MGQGLSNAQLCMHFAPKLMEICKNQYASIFAFLQKSKKFERKNAKFMKKHENSWIFKFSYFSEFSSKLHDKLCVWKPLTDTLHFYILWASASILWAPVSMLVKYIFVKKSYFFKHFWYTGIKNAHRCSWDARGCSQNAKMQNMDQVLSNAQLIM